MVVTIFRVENKRQLKLFEQVPEILHRDNPYFVPPFPGSIVKIFDPKGPFKRIHGELVPFLAFRDKKPVGRIAAIVNRSHNKYYQDKVGFFGFFDFENDVEVARALKEAAAQELKKFGLTSLRGPYSPSINDEVGLLVEGFNSIPSIMTPFNPAYYSVIYEKLGLVSTRDLYAFYLSAEVGVPDRIRKIVERIRKTSGLKIRNVQMNRLKDELKIIHELYNVTLDRNWGFVPMEYAEFEAAAADLKAIIDPTMVMIAEKNGFPVGFALCLPNLNELLWKAGKQQNILLRILKFLWLMKTSRPSTTRLAVLGVRPEYRHAGLGAMFYYEALMRAKERYVGGELSWVEANNEEIIKGIRLMGGEVYKSYKLYESPLGV